MASASPDYKEFVECIRKSFALRDDDDGHLLKPIGDLERAVCKSPEGPHGGAALIFTTDGLVEADVRTRARTAILRCDDPRWLSDAPERYDACGHGGSVGTPLASFGDGSARSRSVGAMHVTSSVRSVALWQWNGGPTVGLARHRLHAISHSVAILAHHGGFGLAARG